MFPPSSPIAYPASSSPVASKRPRPSDAPKPSKPRVLGGFIADDSDDDSDENYTAEQPSPKRRMLHQNTQGVQINTTRNESESLVESLPVAQKITDLSNIQSHEELEDEAERYDRLFGNQGRPILSAFTHITDLTCNTDLNPAPYHLSTCSGTIIPIRERKPAVPISYATMVAARSKTREGRAHKSYYGIAIHELIDDANKQLAEARQKQSESAASPNTTPASPDKPLRSIEGRHAKHLKKRTMLWTEKYRARTFMDLVGDDLTNRQVLRWLKKWDPIVFPHVAATKSRSSFRRKNIQKDQQPEEEKPHRKILMLHGPPGLGKTTLAHVCAQQAGYEVMEINASDERSKDVVKGRIRTSLGTESVKTVENKRPEPGKQQKVARPVCVVVDEVDGVVGGAGGSGEGGFVKALIDLVLLDQKNSSGGAAASGQGRKKKKGDDFKQMRPLILICNDVYHPSLRPLRQSGHAEIIHVGKPTVEAVVTRLKTIFEKEGIPCEKDAARKLCEAAWGMASGIDAKRGAESNAEGDLRGVMVVGEWVAGRLRSSSTTLTPTLTRQWLDRHILHDLAHGGGGARGLAQKHAMARLREMLDTSGDADRVTTEIFLEYPRRDFNDDSFLSKPDAAYEWLHFQDACSARLFGAQEWELAPYLGMPVLAFHHLFASPRRYHSEMMGYGGGGGGGGREGWGGEEENAVPLPFSGPRADYAAREAEKVNRAALQGIHAGLPPALSRAFRSAEEIATDFLPYLVRLVAPDVKPVVVGGSNDKFGAAVASVRREGEKAMVRRAAAVLAEVGIALQRGKIEPEMGPGPAARTQWVYRMEPDLDTLATYETASAYILASQAPTRYAVRQVLDQELQKTIAQKENAARQARLKGGPIVPIHLPSDDKENLPAIGIAEEKAAVKRDFFGRVIVERPLIETDGNAAGKRRKREEKAGGQVWVTYHEGLNNAVRKPISLEEFLRGF
ncbi:Chromosome transmission fidelity protein 18 [Collariella sp. IMI 366227]|nr:Chromosome transmission fidelity protein 18 [Collariella sp. IMI 366227]